ncbi:MAG: DUF3606 domain-containing protein [Mesorhizobium sp.]
MMVDDKTKRDFQGRDRVSADDEYEVRHFAEQNGLTIEQTMMLIRKHGDSPEVLTRAARQLRERGTSEAG